MNTTTTSGRGTYAFQWVMAHTIAWTLAMLLEVQLGDATSDTETGWLVLGGLLIGATEWLVLSRRFPISGWWAVGFGAGWGVALKTGWLFGPYVPNIVWLGGGGGVLVGVHHRRRLRRSRDGPAVVRAARAAPHPRLRPGWS
jgi:hypothetical protein